MTIRRSLNARRLFDDEIHPDAEIVLIEVTHQDFDEPLLISTDPTERLELGTYGPVYGTRSTWRGDGVRRDFLFAGLEVELPGDIPGAPLEARYYLSALDSTLFALLRSIKRPPVARMVTVLSSSIDTPEDVYPPLYVLTPQGADGLLELTLSTKPIDDEPFPGYRMTPARFPALAR